MPPSGRVYQELRKFNFGDTRARLGLVRRSKKYIYGLVAMKQISKGSYIARYPGIVVNQNYKGMWKDYKVETSNEQMVVIPYLKLMLQKAVRGVPFLAAFANEPSPKKRANAEPYKIEKFKPTNGLIIPSAFVIKATRDIEESEEITWCYGNDYDKLRNYNTSCG